MFLNKHRELSLLSENPCWTLRGGPNKAQAAIKYSTEARIRQVVDGRGYLQPVRRDIEPVECAPRIETTTACEPNSAFIQRVVCGVTAISIPEAN